MNEEDTLNEIFGKKFKDKYLVSWCELCDTAIISHDCGGTTCNCHSCKECEADFKEFDTFKTIVEEYLTEDEKKAYHKGRRLKQLILESIGMGQKEIDFKWFAESGKLSELDREMFNIPKEWRYEKIS